ncbi:PepSY domain-containing protein [Gemella sanguinis]
MYDVEARANGLEYDLKIDAVSGKILKVEIDD